MQPQQNLGAPLMRDVGAARVAYGQGDMQASRQVHDLQLAAAHEGCSHSAGSDGASNHCSNLPRSCTACL